MGSNLDDAKGRAKQAVGDLTDNPSLKNEGSADRAGATIKQLAEDARDTVVELSEKAKDKAEELVDHVKKH